MKYKNQNHLLSKLFMSVLAFSLVFITPIIWSSFISSYIEADESDYEEKPLSHVRNSCIPKSIIYIDDNNPNYNWNKTASENEWCSGQGTREDPYIIRNLILNAQNSGCCIIIMCSSIFFRIENCTVLNSSFGSLLNMRADLIPWNVRAGIILDNVENGIIINNSISQNNGFGLFIINSDKNEISENKINNNKDGVVMLYSNFNNITGNKISNNIEDGINLIFCDFNNIISNSINGNKNGIILYFSNFNTISGNNLIENEVFIFKESCSGNIIHNNIFWEDIPDEEDGIPTVPPFNYIPFLILAALIGMAGGLSVGIVVQRHKIPPPAGLPPKKGLKGKQMLVPPIVDAKEYRPDMTRINLNGNETIKKIKEEDSFLRRESMEQLRKKEKRYEAAKELKKEKLHEILNNNDKTEKNLTIIDPPGKEGKKKVNSEKGIAKKGD